MIKFKTEFKNSYWANTGAYSGQILDKLIEELVPDIGRAKTIHGELLRCIINLDYEYHNNGNGNTFGMHNWTNLDSHWEEQLFFLIENMDDKVSAKILKGFVSSASRDVHRFKYYKLYNDVFDSVIYQVFTTKDLLTETDNGYNVEQVKEYYLNSGFPRYVEEPFLSEYDDLDWIEHANESELKL